MKIRVIFISILCSLYSGIIGAQIDQIKPITINDDGFAYKIAIEDYKKQLDIYGPNKDIYKTIADLYYHNAVFRKAEDWYLKTIELDSVIDPEYILRYVQTLKTAQKYADADWWMEKFVLARPDDSRSQLFLDNRDYLTTIAENRDQYTIESQKFNTRFNDFAPTFYDDKLIFSSVGDTTSFDIRLNPRKSVSFYDLYEVDTLHDNLKGKNAIKLIGDINTLFHESTSTISQDGTTMYFTRNNYYLGKERTNKEGDILLKIYSATKNQDGYWGNIVELPFNDDQYSTAHPALSPDETKLYFASNRPGSIGGSDIFVVNINEDGSFGDPENMGTAINTEGRESFPYVTSDNMLFFSSNGRPGLGVLDVFAIDLNKKGNTGFLAYNIGEPVNSPFDDFGFIIDRNNNKGYFNSNRVGGKGGDDIYGLMKIPELKNCEGSISGKVVNFTNGAPLTGVEVKLMLNNKVLETVTTGEDASFKFLADCTDNTYQLIIDSSGFNHYEATVKLTEMNTRPSIQLTPITAIEEGMDIAKVIDLNKIYFNYDKSDIRNDAKIELNRVITYMKQNPYIKVEVRSHTDSRGPDEYNLELSDKRAKSTAAYMISQGISPNRISGKGYGERQLLNACVDGTICSDDEHEFNRRSEFIITGSKNIGIENLSMTTIKEGKITTIDFDETYYTVQLGLFKEVPPEHYFKGVLYFKSNKGGQKITAYYSGTFDLKEEAVQYKEKMIAKGFKDAFIIQLKANRRIPITK